MFAWTHESGPRGVRTLIAVCLLKFGTAGVAIFPTVGIYYYSYFRLQEPDKNYSDMVLMYSLCAVLMAVFSLFSVCIANRVGHALVVRVLCFLYPFSLLRASYCETSQCFNYFAILVSALLVGLGLMPVLCCLWSFFRQNKGKATGLALTIFGISTVFYTILSQQLINPHNLPVKAIYDEDGVEVNMYFPEEIALKVPMQVRIIAIVQGVFCLAGVVLISQNDENIAQVHEIIDESAKTHQTAELNDISERARVLRQADTDGYGTAPGVNTSADAAANTNDKITTTLNELGEQIIKRVSDAVVTSELPAIDAANEAAKEGAYVASPSANECPDLKTALLSAPFRIIWVTTMLMSLHSLYLSLNYKVFGLQKINDDRTLTYIFIASAVIGSALGYFWGIAKDRYHYKSVYYAIFLSYAVLGTTFPFVASNVWLFFIWYLLLNTIERGLYNVIGPVMIDIFGFRTGTLAFPFKITSWITALGLAPTLHFFFGESVSMDTIVIVLGLLVFVSFWISTWLRD